VLRAMVWIAFAIVLVTDFGYLLIIRAQESHPPDAFTVPFVAVFLALMAAMLGASLLGTPTLVRLRPALRAGAASGLLVIGVIALWSIGLLLVLAGAPSYAFRLLQFGQRIDRFERESDHQLPLESRQQLIGVSRKSPLGALGFVN